MKPTWIQFDPQDTTQFPPERRMVLVITAEQPDKGLPAGVAVGYLRLHSVPFFVIPGIGGSVTHWADCLGDEFMTPVLRNHHDQRWQLTNGQWGTE